MKDQTGQEILVGQTVAISVESGLRIGDVIDVNPGATQLKVDSTSRPGKLVKIWYTRPHRARIIAQPAVTPIMTPEKVAPIDAAAKDAYLKANP